VRDRLLGGAGRDSLWGGLGADQLRDSRDRVHAGPGDDVVYESVDMYADEIWCGDGRDTVVVSDVLLAGSAPNVFHSCEVYRSDLPR